MYATVLTVLRQGTLRQALRLAFQYINKYYNILYAYAHAFIIITTVKSNAALLLFAS